MFNANTEQQMQTTSRDYASKAYLRIQEEEEDRRGFLGLIRDAFGAVLASGTILLLVVVALGWTA